MKRILLALLTLAMVSNARAQSTPSYSCTGEKRCGDELGAWIAVWAFMGVTAGIPILLAPKSAKNFLGPGGMSLSAGGIVRSSRYGQWEHDFLPVKGIEGVGLRSTIWGVGFLDPAETLLRYDLLASYLVSGNEWNELLVLFGGGFKHRIEDKTYLGAPEAGLSWYLRLGSHSRARLTLTYSDYFEENLVEWDVRLQRRSQMYEAFCDGCFLSYHGLNGLLRGRAEHLIGAGVAF